MIATIKQISFGDFKGSLKLLSRSYSWASLLYVNNCKNLITIELCGVEELDWNKNVIRLLTYSSH